MVFVTTMILWMNTNARNMKSSLESEAQSSLSSGGEKAMAGMAFLAIIKEGFETAVFMLAVFQASSAGSEWLGIAGAVLGVVIAIVIGYLIYYGGARFNLGTFFKVTGPFLILVAAGFVANCFLHCPRSWLGEHRPAAGGRPFLAYPERFGGGRSSYRHVQHPG